MLLSQPGSEHRISKLPSGTVTFLFTDIEGSTDLLDMLGEHYADVLEEHREIMRAALSSWNGLEIDTWADSHFIAFRRAIDAVNCAMQTQRTLANHPWPRDVSVRVRMGLHTGEPSLREAEIESGAENSLNGSNLRPHYIGMDVHRVARIASVGYGGQVLLSQTTRDLVYQGLPEGVSLRDMGSHMLKDLRFPQQIYQLEIQGLPNEFPPLKTISMVTDPYPLVDSVLAIPSGQREADAYRNLLKRWRAQGQETLDKASLAMLLGSPPELSIDQDELVFLLRSALKYELSLDTWIKLARSPAVIVNALEKLFQEYPRPQSRLIIVETLGQIQDPQATQLLMQIAATDDAHNIRSQAALEAASRGMHEQVTQELTRQAREQSDPAVLAALVAVIDEYGLPEGSLAYSKLPVVTGLLQRHWISNRETVWRLSKRGALGGSLAMGLLGSSLPMLSLLIIPNNYIETVKFFSVGAWCLSGAIAGMVWGGLQGLASGFAVSFADLFSPVWRSSGFRFVAGGIAGIVFSVMMIVFASAGLFSPVARPLEYIPVFVAYGFLQGGALSWVIPKTGKHISWRSTAVRALQTTLFIGIIALPLIYLVYRESSLSRLPLDWLYAILMSCGLAVATRKE